MPDQSDIDGIYDALRPVSLALSAFVIGAITLAITYQVVLAALFHRSPA